MAKISGLDGHLIEKSQEMSMIDADSSGQWNQAMRIFEKAGNGYTTWFEFLSRRNLLASGPPQPRSAVMLAV